MPDSSRFQCTLTRADQHACTAYARVTITDAAGGTARGCPQHAIAALDGIDGARVDWADTKGLNEYEQKALQVSEELSAHRARLTPQAEPELEAEPGIS